MSEDVVQAPYVGEGQAVDSGSGTEIEAPVVAASGQGEEHAEPAPTEPEDSWFDPKQLPDDPQIQKAYKSLQGSYTKKMQSLAEQRKAHEAKVAAYDAFEADPIGTIQQVAKQYGLNLTRAEAAAVAQPQQTDEWVPQTWDEVLSRAEEAAERRILSKLSPVLDSFQKQTAQSFEQALDELDPQWRDYEDEMRATLKEHPSLSRDISKLYRVSVPDSVWTARATQRALAQIQKKTQAGAVHAGGGVKAARPAPKIESFDDAIAAARAELARGGT